MIMYSAANLAHRKMNYLVLCCLLTAGSCLAGVTRSNAYGDFYGSLPEELKQPFLKYQLAVAVTEDTAHSRAISDPSLDNLLTAEGLGIPETVFSNLEELNTPLGFSNHLYKLVTEDFGLNFGQVIYMITSESSKAEGGWDIGDVGSHCC